ncbi:MAG: M23 family metallopeptidase [Gammaproteobacteria bacterium]|nr:M23 family metallopeptidase [Gammaproteobacteria bacterium]
MKVSYQLLLSVIFVIIFSNTSWASKKNIDDLIEIRGEFIEGAILFGKTSPDTLLFFQNKAIKLTTDGQFVLGLHRDEKPNATLKIITSDGTKLEKQITIADREYQIQRIDGLPKSKVTPRGKKLMKRIQDEIKMAKNARDRVDNRLDFLQPFIWPATGRISGVYGSQRILNGSPRRPHFGVDIAKPTGSPVIAPTDGVITLAHPDMFFSGGTIILDHGFGLSSSFLHLSKLHVKVGQRVNQGDLIGEIGATGRVTGAHLDWRMNWLDKRVDPQTLVPPMQTVLNQSGK